MADKPIMRRDVPLPASKPAAGGDVQAFLDLVGKTPPREPGGRGRLIFALDATLSRQPTWDAAARLQGEMFMEAAALGGLDVQLVFYRGFNECRASRWVGDAGAIVRLMTGVACRAGTTQIARVLRHAARESGRGRVHALVFIGDALEENIDELGRVAGELSLLGVRGFFFQEGRDATVEQGYRELARLTGGAWCRFDRSAPAELRALLRAVAAYAAGGMAALRDLRRRDGGGPAKLLLQQLAPETAGLP